MTRQKPASQAPHIFADFDEALADRTQELLLEDQDTRHRPYRYDFSKMRALASNAANEEAKRTAQAYTEPRSSSPPTLPMPSPSSDSSLDFELVPAVYADIPALVQIHIDAYVYDQMTQLLRRGTDPEKYKRWLTEMVQRSWGKTSKDTWILVAKRKSDGEALGCAVYQIHDKAGEETVRAESGEDGEQPMEELIAMMRWGCGGAEVGRKSMARDEDELGTKDETPAPAPPKDRKLEEVARAGMMAMHERWVPAGTRYMYLGSLAVSSQHQSHGVGGALLHAGMSRADAEGLLIWLEATPAGHPVYEHYGWKTVDSSSVRLQDFAGPRGEQAGWGVYRASGCLRMPMLVEKGKEKEKEKEKEMRWGGIDIEEEERRRENEEVGKKKREDEKWWNDEWDTMHRERKLRKEKQRERRNAVRESRKDEDKTEASRRSSERRNEKRMSEVEVFQKEEAEGESHSWNRYREILDKTSRVTIPEGDWNGKSMFEVDNEIWEIRRKAAEEQRAMEGKHILY